jgi:hypothetical protein
MKIGLALEELHRSEIARVGHRYDLDLDGGPQGDPTLLERLRQEVSDRELLDVTRHCHPQTLRQAKWANAQLKLHATQILVS